MELTFNGLHHRDDIDTTKGIKGIYVWGFLYFKSGDVKKNCEICSSEHHPYDLMDCRDVEKIKKSLEEGKQIDLLFIPYYVGMASAKGGIKSRLEDHINFENETFNKYVRLKEEYMRCYHMFTFDLGKGMNLPKFPIMKGSVNSNHSWLLLAEFLQYFNRHSICKQIHSSLIFDAQKEDKNYSFDSLKNDFGSGLIDPLRSRIERYNNFWFCYAAMDNNSTPKDFHQAESTTFFSLKGITFSRTYSLNKTQTAQFTVDDQTGFDIFLKKPCEFSWPGYF